MIFGDPNRFAIQCDVVPSWNTGNWTNGILFIHVGGILAGGTSALCEDLRTQLHQLENRCSVLKHQHFFSEMNVYESDAEIFERLHQCANLSVGDEELGECHDFSIAPTAVSDSGYAMFLVVMGDVERLFLGHYKEALIRVVDLNVGECCDVINQARRAISERYPYTS